MSYKGTKTVAFDNTVSELWAYFYCACAETPTSNEPLVKKSDPAIRSGDLDFL